MSVNKQHVTSREAMLFMKYEHYGKCKGSIKDSQRKCGYLRNKFNFWCVHGLYQS